jgi:hypothetical protein
MVIQKSETTPGPVPVVRRIVPDASRRVLVQRVPVGQEGRLRRHRGAREGEVVLNEESVEYLRTVPQDMKAVKTAGTNQRYPHRAFVCFAHDDDETAKGDGQPWVNVPPGRTAGRN